MTQILGTIEWKGMEYLRILPDEGTTHCGVCHFNDSASGCPTEAIQGSIRHGLMCADKAGGGCFVTRDELIRKKLKGEL